MGIGASIFLIAIGAILAFAVNVQLDWVNLDLIGYILMGAGVVVFIIGLVLLMLAGFALPPVLASVNTAPVRVFQRAADTQRGSIWGLVAAVVAIAGLLWLQAGSLKLAGFVLGGALATSSVLALFAWLLVRGLAGIRSRGGIAWRFGLGNIARRKGAAVAQIVALGIALIGSATDPLNFEGVQGHLELQAPNPKALLALGGAGVTLLMIGSFKAYATNGVSTVYTAVATFITGSGSTSTSGV